MRSSVRRHAPKSVVLCLLAAVLCALWLAPRARASTMAPHGVSPDRVTRAHAFRAKEDPRPTTIAPAVFAYAPASDVAKPTRVVYLHGIHGLAQNGCPWLRGGATEVGWLLCPEANAALPNGTFSWGGTAKDQYDVVTHAIRASGGEPNDGDVLVGFSQGGFVAVDLVEKHLGTHRGLVILSADVHIDATTLRGAGVERIVLGAGSLDATYAPLETLARSLDAQGFPARFVSLGRVGHTYVPEDTAVLTDAIVWASGARTRRAA